MSIPDGVTQQEESRLRDTFKNAAVDSFPIGIKTPLELGERSGDTLFKMHYKIEDQIADNLKNLILTRKGERLGFYDFGTNIHRAYSAGLDENTLVDFVMEEISTAVSKYMPAIDLKNFYGSELKDEELEQSIRDGEAISTNSLENLRDKKAESFYSSLENTETFNATIKKNNDLEIIYKIVVEYQIPAEISSQSQSLELFIRTSR